MTRTLGFRYPESTTQRDEERRPVLQPGTTGREQLLLGGEQVALRVEHLEIVGHAFTVTQPRNSCDPLLRCHGCFERRDLFRHIATPRERIGNFAPYALIGGKLSRDMQSQEDVNQSLQDGYILKLAKGNSSLDVGAGADFFLPFFKFSVEMKTEFGMRNVLIQDDTPFSAAFDQLRTRSFIISFTFEG